MTALVSARSACPASFKVIIQNQCPASKEFHIAGGYSQSILQVLGRVHEASPRLAKAATRDVAQR